MPNIPMISKGDAIKTALLLVAAGGGLVAARYIERRHINGAERLANALLDTGKLTNAARTLPDSTECVLAACAAYAVNMAYRAAEGVGSAGGEEDPIGYSRTHTHPYSHVVATVLTEANAPEQLLTYAVTIPDVGDVRGTRRVGAVNAGLPPTRPTPDAIQFSLADEYSAQFESEFEVGEYLVLGRTRLTGAATLRDNRDNVGRLNIAPDGAISGTITRNARVIGRFEGNAAHGLYFSQHQIEGGS